MSVPPGAHTDTCTHCGRPVWVLPATSRTERVIGHIDPDDMHTNGTHAAHVPRG